MDWFERVTGGRKMWKGTAPSLPGAGGGRTRPTYSRREAEALGILFRLDDRMRSFRPMIERVLESIERETELAVWRPQNVTYAYGDPYFPMYEWRICQRRTRADAMPDPRQVILQLRASPGRDLTVILVYYLLSFVDEAGDEHALHQQPEEIRNERRIKELLWAGIQGAGLAEHPSERRDDPG